MNNDKKNSNYKVEKRLIIPTALDRAQFGTVKYDSMTEEMHLASTR